MNASLLNVADPFQRLAGLLHHLGEQAAIHNISPYQTVILVPRQFDRTSLQKTLIERRVGYTIQTVDHFLDRVSFSGLGTVKQTGSQLSIFRQEKERLGFWTEEAKRFFAHREKADWVLASLHPENKVPMKPLLNALQELLYRPEWLPTVRVATLMKAGLCLYPKVAQTRLLMPRGIQLVGLLDYQHYSTEEQFFFEALTQAPEGWLLPSMVVATDGSHWLSILDPLESKIKGLALPASLKPHPDIHSFFNQSQGLLDASALPASGVITLTALKRQPSSSQWRTLLLPQVMTALAEGQNPAVVCSDNQQKLALLEAFPEWSTEVQQATATLEAHLRYWCGLSAAGGGHPLAIQVEPDQMEFDFRQRWYSRRTREEFDDLNVSLFLDDEQAFLEEKTTSGLIRRLGLEETPFLLPEDPYRALSVLIAQRARARVKVYEPEQSMAPADTAFVLSTSLPDLSTLPQELGRTLQRIHFIYLKDGVQQLEEGR